MKKRILSFATLALAVFHVAAAPVSFFSARTPDFEIKQGVQVNVKESAKNTGAQFFAITGFDLNELCGDVGVCVSGGALDIKTQLVYWPRFFQKFNFGGGLTYHFYDSDGFFSEHDVLAGLYFRLNPGKIFTLYTRFCYFCKAAVIPAVSSALPALCDNSIDYEFTLSWAFAGWLLFGSFSTNSFFDYPLFCTPFFSTGFERRLFGSVFAGTEISSMWLDMFTVAANLTQLDLKFYCRMKI